MLKEWIGRVRLCPSSCAPVIVSGRETLVSRLDHFFPVSTAMLVAANDLLAFLFVAFF